MIDVTIAMPLFNMGQIATLALEGLCQQKTTCKWELIICEEQTDNMLSKKKLDEYESRLKNAGCVLIKYLPLTKWIPLGKKWKLISDNTSDSICFILQAGDCFSHSNRIQETFNSISNGYDYYDENKGYWYSFRLNKTILWEPNKSYNHPCRLNMGWKTELFKKLPDNDVSKNVDGYIYRTISSKVNNLKKFRNETLYIDGVDTDGYNCISSRDEFFIKLPNNIFKESDIDITNSINILNIYKGKNLNKRIKDNE